MGGIEDWNDVMVYSVGVLASIPASIAVVYAGAATYSVVSAARDRFFDNSEGKSFRDLYRDRFEESLR